MTEPTPAAEGPPVLALPPELTIYTAGELHPQWLAWLERDTALVDGRAVDQVDGAGLQLLLSLAHALAQRGRSLQLQSPSRALAEGCCGLGLAAWLQDHTAAEVAA